MQITATDIDGVMLIKPEVLCDERGFFTQTWHDKAFQIQGLPEHFSFCALSHNKKKGTLRGLHFQKGEAAQSKLIRCEQGAVYDVVVDLRAQSPTYRQWLGFELNAHSLDMLYIPPGCAHGFQTLCDDARLFYHIKGHYHPEQESGIHWASPTLNIPWPIEKKMISERDKNWQKM